jgi:hypothetical protein
VGDPSSVLNSTLRLVSLDEYTGNSVAAPRIALPMPIAAERLSAQADELSVTKSHLSALSGRVKILYYIRLALLSLGWVGLGVGAGFLLTGAPILGLMALVTAICVLLSAILGWTSFQHSDFGRRWVANFHPGQPISISEMFLQLRKGHGQPQFPNHKADLALLDSAFSVLLCSTDQHVRKLVRGKDNQSCSHALTVLMERAPAPSTAKLNQNHVAATETPGDPRCINHGVGAFDEGLSGDIASLSKDVVVVVSLPVQVIADVVGVEVPPAYDPPQLEQRYKFDWVRGFGIDAVEAAARVEALVVPTEVVNPVITKAGLKAALSHMINYPMASLQDAVNAAEISLEKQFQSVGKRKEGASAAWLAALLKKPPVWLLEGMHVSATDPPFSQILDFPIQFAPPKIMPGKAGTLMGKAVDEL